MKKSLLLMGLALSVGTIKIFPQAMGNAEYETSGNNNYKNNYLRLNGAAAAYVQNNNEISITVNGLMNLLADNYVAIFSIVQVAENIENADALMNNRISAFKQRLKKTGIDTLEVKTDMISFVPKYDIQTEQKLFSKVYNEIPAGFELQKTVSVRFKNSAKLDDIMTAAAGSEIFDLVKVDYFIPNIQRSLDSLRKKCLQEYKSKLKDYEMIGFKLDTLKKTFADNFITTYPPTRYASYTAFTRPSLQAAKKKSQPVLNEIQKPVSKYYSQLDYDKFDLVVNPVITEPAVQISYSLVVKYFLNETRTPSNKYYLIGQSGEPKQIFPK